MTTQAQTGREKTWLEKLEEFLTDEFHYGLHRIITETNWGSHVLVGAWTDQLRFFECLNSQREFIVTNQNKPQHIRFHLQGLNFSGKSLSGGERNKFLADQLPKNLQNILLLHSLRLVLENREKQINLRLIVPIVHREIHQCIRLVFFHHANGPHAKGLEEFVDEISEYEWLPINDVRQRLQIHITTWLEKQGVEAGDVSDSSRLGRFWRTLTKFKHYHPQFDEPVDFKYGHLFSNWQKYGFFTRMIYEIDLLSSLVSLETLSHSSTPTVLTEPFEQLQQLSERRTKGGSRYQNQLAIHYILRSLRANDNNTRKANLASFLTGFSEHTLRQQWSNIHSKKDENGVEWEADMRVIRGYFQDIGLADIVRQIDDDLKD